MDAIHYIIRDSHGIAWDTSVSGPTASGALRPRQPFSDLPPRWIASFRSLGRAEITLDLYALPESAEELRQLLEQQPD